MMNFADVAWAEGKRFTLPPASYHHAITIVCTEKGRQEGTFANGVFRYFALMEFVSGSEGVNIVPVLPDGRVLMVVEERPIVSFWNDAPRILRRASGDVALGKYQSVEFPAGGMKSGESPERGALRELQEETGIPDQEIELCRMRPVYPLSSNVVLRAHYAVAFLSDARFAAQVETDGGLSVIALIAEDVERNIRSGILADAATVLMGWNFYKEIRDAKKNPERMEQLKKDGYLTVETVRLKTQAVGG